MQKLAFRVVAVATALFVASISQAVPIEWQVIDGGNGHFYEFVPGSLDWTAAKDAAAAATFGGQPGHLVTILSSAENDFIENIVLAPAGESPWIGATDEVVEGEWRWVTGELFWLGGPGGSVQGGLFANWGAGIPDNFGNEDWAYIPATVSIWADQPHSTPNPNGYVVEFEAAVPEPSTALLLGLGLIGLATRQKSTLR